MGTLLTVEEVADRLHVSPAAVRRWLRDGKMGGIQLPKKWLVSEDDLQEFITSRTQKPKSDSAKREE